LFCNNNPSRIRSIFTVLVEPLHRALTSSQSGHAHVIRLVCAGVHAVQEAALQHSKYLHYLSRQNNWKVVKRDTLPHRLTTQGRGLSLRGQVASPPHRLTTRCKSVYWMSVRRASDFFPPPFRPPPTPTSGAQVQHCPPEDVLVHRPPFLRHVCGYLPRLLF